MADGQGHNVADNNAAQPAQLLKPKSTNDCQVKGCDFNRRKPVDLPAVEPRIAAFTFPRNQHT